MKHTRKNTHMQTPATARRMLAVSIAPFVIMSVMTWWVVPVHAQQAGVDDPMLNMPTLVLPETITVWPDGMADLWIMALDRPEIELNVEACYAIDRAHREGMPDLEATVPSLLKLLNASNKPQNVRDAAAKALVTLEARTAVPDLEQANRQNVTSMILITDPFLAKHTSRTMTPIWMDRLIDQDVCDPARISAAQSLPDNLQPEQRESLLQTLTDQATSWPLRQAIAQAVGRQKQRANIISTFRTQTPKRPGIFWRLIQAEMLNAHIKDEQPLLTHFIAEAGTEAQPSAWLALKKLNEVDAWTITIPEGSGPKLIANSDVSYREELIQALAHRGDIQAVTVLGLLLSDLDPHNRQTARDTMLRLSKRDDKLKSTAIQAAMKQLDSKDWRGQEQAALLLGGLHHQPAQPRLIELLKAKRQEVGIAAIIGLRRLTEARLPRQAKPTTPDDDPAMLALVNISRSILERMKDPKSTTEQQRRDNERLTQIFQTFGLVRYRSDTAMDMLQQFIPKNSFGTNPRSAAIWAIGRIEQDTANARFVNLFSARLADVNPTDPESDQVRRASAIAIGWIKPDKTPRTLEEFSDLSDATPQITLACRWAIQRITGKTQPPLEPGMRVSRQWFLVPTRK